MSITERALLIVRSGRKRKPGKRKPSGDLRQVTTDPKVIAFAMPHRQSVPAEIRHDPKAENALGRFRLNGTITEPQYHAGHRYAAIVASYRSSIEAPRAGQSIAGIMEPRTGSGMDISTAREIKDKYDKAFAAVFAAGQVAAKTVARVAVHDVECGVSLLIALRSGLDALAAHYGLTDSRKSVNRGE